MMINYRKVIICILMISLLLSGCGNIGGISTPETTKAPTITPIFYPDNTPTTAPEDLPSPTPRPTKKPYQKPTFTPSPTAVPTIAPQNTPAENNQSAVTPTTSPTATPTKKVVATNTPTSIPSKSVTATPTKKVTETPVPTKAAAREATLTPTAVPSATATSTPSATPTITNTPTPTLVPDVVLKLTAVAYASEKTVIYKSYNTRSGVIAYPSKGTFLQIAHQIYTNNTLWYRVVANNQIGWVMESQVSYISPTPTPTYTPTPKVTPIPNIPAHDYYAYPTMEIVTPSPTPSIPSAYKSLEQSVTNDNNVFWIDVVKTYESSKYGTFTVEELYADKRSDLGQYTTIIYSDKTSLEYSTKSSIINWYGADGTRKEISKNSPYKISTYDSKGRLIAEEYQLNETSKANNKKFYMKAFIEYEYEENGTTPVSTVKYKLFTDANGKITQKLSGFRLLISYSPLIMHNDPNNFDYMDLLLWDGTSVIIYNDMIRYIKRD